MILRTNDLVAWDKREAGKTASKQRAQKSVIIQTDNPLTRAPFESWLVARQRILARTYKLIEQLDVGDSKVAPHGCSRATPQIASIHDEHEMKPRDSEIKLFPETIQGAWPVD